MTPTSQMNNNIRNLIASAKAPVVDKLQECLEENRKLRLDILDLKGQLESATEFLRYIDMENGYKDGMVLFKASEFWDEYYKAPFPLHDCHCPPGIREGVLDGPICHACERQLEELYGDEIPF